MELLKHQADARAVAVDFARTLAPNTATCRWNHAKKLAFDFNQPNIRLDEIVDASQQCALTATARADDTNDFSAVDHQLNSRKRLVIAEIL